MIAPEPGGGLLSLADPTSGRIAARLHRLRSWTLPHVAPRPVELLRPDVLLRANRMQRRLHAAELTILTARRARTLYRLARSVERRGVPGAIVDCGVWNGGSTMLLAQGAPTRAAWAFDSFEGLPAPTAMDAGGPSYPEGTWRGSREAVERGFESLGLRGRLHVVAGCFEDTLAESIEAIGAIALLHVDADYYEAVKLALQTCYPSVSAGGYVLVDDYFSFPGARRATDEVRALHGVTHPMVCAHFWQR